MAGARNSKLDGMSGAELRALFEGACRAYHSQLYDLRAAFAQLHPDDPDRNAGIAVTELADLDFHAMQERINLMATVATAYIAGKPLIVVESAETEGQVLGIEVWMPESHLTQD